MQSINRQQLFTFRSAFNRLATIVLLTGALTSCNKLVSVNAPYTSVNQANVYADVSTATAVLNGIYTNMSDPYINGGFTGMTGISLLADLSADNLTLYSGVANSDTKYFYYTNSLFSTAAGGAGSELWSPAYNFIFTCNAAIGGLTSSTGLAVNEKQQLLGESYFMRAFFYFYLVNLYGDVPLITSTNYKTTESLPRAPAAQVYSQIVADLKNAQGLLSTSYVDQNLQAYGAGNEQRVRPTKWAAMALLARTYLYTNDWVDAQQESDSVIASPLFSLPALNNAFLSGSPEAIWQLQPVSNQENTADAWVFVIPSTGPDPYNYPVYLSNTLLNSFEPGDQRRLNWVDSVIVGTDTFYFPYKYKSATLNAPLTEYLMMLRLGEQYLIRAEAEAQQGNIAGAQADLNAIRSRAMLGNSGASDKGSLLTAILHERQVELFTEMGHRWLDLKRAMSVDAVMTIVTPMKSGGNAWQPYQQLYPLPFSDLKADPNLTQNQGY
jgi:starch-binding outer membrane protein, SusD/RagB family